MKNTKGISGNTKLVALLGSPVDHSKAPAMHSASFVHSGIDARYIAFDVTQSEIPTVVKAIKLMDFAGFNLTMPDKTCVMGELDEISQEAQLIGAVNTVKIEDGKAFGYNTDGKGFMLNLAEHGFNAQGKRMTLVGAGGAGSAIFVQAAFDGMDVDVFNIKDSFYDPTVEKAKKTSLATGRTIRVHDLNDQEAFRKSCMSADILVNASSVGMVPFENECLFPEEFIPQGAFVADTIYNPLETKLIRAAKKKGNPVVPGLGMMLWQGILGEKIWFDFEPNIEVMKKAIF